MTTVPKIADYSPKAVELEAGKDYWFCTCGLSANQPFCDSSHKGTGMKSHKFTAEKTGTAWLCMCKNSKNIPFCDGTHSSLKD